METKVHSFKVQRNELLISGYCRMESNNMNIIDGILLIIFKYQRTAKWSNKYKGNMIELSEYDSKATCLGAYAGHSVRTDTGVKKGEIESWELEFYIIETCSNFIGVVTSKSMESNFNYNPSSRMEDALEGYGIDDDDEYYYDGMNSTKGYERLTWEKPAFPKEQSSNIKLIVDWRGEQCKLIFYYNGKKLNDTVDEYTMLLPVFDDDIILYPCVTPYNKGAYCVIHYV